MKKLFPKKETGQVIGHTTNCIKCGCSCFDSSGKERPAALPCGHVMKDGNIVKANFCSGWCIGAMIDINPLWNGMPWKQADGFKKL